MRRPVKKKTHVEPDLKYQSLLVSKIINRIMVAGKKSIATGIVYRALELAEEKTKKPALEVLETAITNAAPNMELKSRRVGGANYQVPIEVRPDRKIALAIRWMVEAARSGKGKPMQEKFSEELLNAFNNTGGAVKKKLDMHRMADANKAFAHFAW
ncbi:MAG: 30S ribosomal protein S7 [Candidatus Yanofskybacteria bacterium RIFCSPHIGHO2_02_FULL_50_12]|uniref:Small ribosomal subunit protein uS7 n=1 Tax=Candidatus Yanofskybacteria bacterium RIFCSPHIGHO2_02_FULL_50_12 TaxID=1802685 RepID=A0A1F8FX39_9BACT|nr:MAG: 30S ribosomal protein S7 [Candidatus Yanofskybacteria bacterium RIFCSPHIGHO2_02_FULL_50_12]